MCSYEKEQQFKTSKLPNSGILGKSLLSGNRVFGLSLLSLFKIFFTNISVKTFIIKCHFLSLSDALNISILISCWGIWGKELTSSATASVRDNTRLLS